MDAVTTALVAAVLSGAHRNNKVAAEAPATPEVEMEPVGSAYQALKEALIERFDGAASLMNAIRQLEGMDNARNRQMLHQEVKMMRADQARAVVMAADALLKAIRQQPQGEELLLQARTWEKFS